MGEELFRRKICGGFVGKELSREKEELWRRNCDGVARELRQKRAMGFRSSCASFAPLPLCALRGERGCGVGLRLCACALYRVLWSKPRIILHILGVFVRVCLLFCLLLGFASLLFAYCLLFLCVWFWLSSMQRRGVERRREGRRQRGGRPRGAGRDSAWRVASEGTAREAHGPQSGGTLRGFV